MKYLFLSLILSSLQVFADGTPAPEPECTEILQSYGNVNVHRMMNSSKDCWISITPLKTDEPLKYRSYLVSSNGLLMVFNSFGEGSEDQTTGAREFYFFPRKNKVLDPIPNEKNKTLAVKMTNDQVLTFSTVTGQLVSLSQAVVSVDRKVHPSNKGGVQIKNNQAGIFLDCGFELGTSPTQDPYSTCSFIDSKNKSCTIMNHRIFNYEDGENRPRSDEELARVYERFCAAKN